MSHPLNKQFTPLTPREFTQKRLGSDRLADRLQDGKARDFEYVRGDRQIVRSVVLLGGGATFDVTRAQFDSAVNNCDGSNPTDTQWIGYETGTGDLTNLSAVIQNYTGNPVVGDKITGSNIPVNTTISAVDPIAKTITMNHNATGTAAGVALRFTGIAHAYPAAANGFYQFGLNLYPAFNPDFLIPPGSPASSASITGKIEILDNLSNVLLTATRVHFFQQFFPAAGDGLLNLTSDTMDVVTTLPTFYGVRFSIIGGNFLIGQNALLPRSLRILDPKDLVVQK